jgi:hypothetical protein
LSAREPPGEWRRTLLPLMDYTLAAIAIERKSRAR